MSPTSSTTRLSSPAGTPARSRQRSATASGNAATRHSRVHGTRPTSPTHGRSANTPPRKPKQPSTTKPATPASHQPRPTRTPPPLSLRTTPNEPPTAAARLAQGDPLAPHRRVLGDERSNRIAELATAAAARTAAQTRADLLAQRDAAAPAWERLDRAGAYETRSIQADRQTATTRAQEHLDAAEQLEKRAGQTRGVRGRAERRTLEQAAANRREIAGAEQLEVERLTRAEQDLHDTGRHLDDWIATDGGHAAVWVAAERELANRREHDIAARVELAATAAARPRPRTDRRPAKPRRAHTAPNGKPSPAGSSTTASKRRQPSPTAHRPPATPPRAATSTGA